MDPVKSRDQAKLDGDKHFFTGVLCVNGHMSKRYTNNGRCLTCENIKSIEYVRIHKKSILLNKAKNRAKKKGLEFNIDVSDVVIPKICPVLGIDIITDLQGRYTHNSPSIDRIDNDKGHNIDNFHLACLDCNLKRRRRTDEKFLFTKQLNIIKQDK